MKNPDRNENTIERVTEIYVAVFPIPISEDQMAETILAGFQGDSNRANMSVVRATVETRLDAVQDLVALCDEIVNDQKEVESYRLLKFDKDGIHVLNPDDFRIFEQGLGETKWGIC